MPGPKVSAHQKTVAQQLRAVGEDETAPAVESGPPRPDPPSALGEPGQQLWRLMIETLDALPGALYFEPRELDALQAACATEDRIAELELAIERDGVMIDGQRGARLNPAIPELRLSREAKLRLLGQVRLEDTAHRSPRSEQAANAAQVRWGMERQKRGRRGA